MQNPVVLAKMAWAMLRLVRDPSRLDIVFNLVDSFDDGPRETPEWRALLARPDVVVSAQARVRLPAIDIEALERMSAGSLGRAFAAFLRENELDPNALPRRAATTEMEWVGAYLYETHDVWHVATGFGPDVAGELGLQAFYAAQLPDLFPLAILSVGMLNTLLFAPSDRMARLAAMARGFRMGRRARALVGVAWADLWEVPLVEVQRRLAIVTESDPEPASLPFAAAA